MAGYAPAPLPSLSLVFNAPSNSVGNPASLPSLGLVLGSTTSKTLTGAVGSYALTGIAAALKAGLKLVSAAGSYSESGQAATLTLVNSGIGVSAPAPLPSMSLVLERATGDKLMAGAVGSFVLSGVAAGGLRGTALVAGIGSFSWSGAPALRDLQVTADKGTFSETANAATLSLVTPGIVAAAGSFAISSLGAALVYQPTGTFVLAGDVGSFLLTGNAASFPTTIARVLQCDKGAFAMTANPVIFTYVGWSRIDASASAWTSVSASSTTWTAQ